MKAVTCIMILGMAGFGSYGQTIAFKGQLLDKNSNVVKNYTVTIDGISTTTDDSGVFNTPIAANKAYVDIKTLGKSYVIAYPLGGRVLVPKDPSLLTQIVLDGFDSNDKVKKYIETLGALTASAKKGQADTKALQAKVDSLAASLQKIGYTNDDLRAAKERQDGIDLFYPAISSDLQDFILQAQGLMNAYKFIGAIAFDNVNALTQYAQIINSFNQAYQKLFINYPTYSKKMIDYWNDPSLTAEFGNITDTLLYGIGRDKIVPLNDLKNKVNEYNVGNLSKDDKAKLKNDVQSQIALRIPPITDQLNAMELRVRKFLDRLKD